MADEVCVVMKESDALWLRHLLSARLDDFADSSWVQSPWAQRIVSAVDVVFGNRRAGDWIPRHVPRLAQTDDVGNRIVSELSGSHVFSRSEAEALLFGAAELD